MVTIKEKIYPLTSIPTFTVYMCSLIVQKIYYMIKLSFFGSNLLHKHQSIFTFVNTSSSTICSQWQCSLGIHLYLKTVMRQHFSLKVCPVLSPPNLNSIPYSNKSGSEARTVMLITPSMPSTPFISETTTQSQLSTAPQSISTSQIFQYQYI